MGGILRVSTPGGEPNAVCMTRHLQPIEGAVCVLFAFHRANDHTIPAIVGGDFRVKSFERQLSTYRLCLFRASERTALHHPAAFVFFLRRRFWRVSGTSNRRSLLRLRLRARVRRGLQQILVRLLSRSRFRLARLRLYRRGLRRTRLLLPALFSRTRLLSQALLLR